MNPRKAAGILAGLVLLAGLLLLALPTSTTVGGYSVGCGSAVGGVPDDLFVDEFGAALEDIRAGGTGNVDVDDACAARLGVQRLIGWPVAAVGVGGLVFLALTASKRGETVSSA